MKVESLLLRVERKNSEIGLMFNFEKLDVWQKAIVFTDSIYSITQEFPPEERFGLTNQMRRAAVSLPSNIAEGSSRNSQNDFGRFVEIGTGSLFEVVSECFVARRRKFLSDGSFQSVYANAEELSRMLSGLRKALLTK